MNKLFVLLKFDNAFSDFITKNDFSFKLEKENINQVSVLVCHYSVSVSFPKWVGVKKILSPKNIRSKKFGSSKKILVFADFGGVLLVVLVLLVTWVIWTSNPLNSANSS